MKKTCILCITAVALWAMASPASGEEASVKLGRQLFNSEGLGASTNGTSCNTCHDNGEGLEKAGAKADLAAMINRCITGPLKGQALNEKTVAMESLKLYIRSLAR